MKLAPSFAALLILAAPVAAAAQDQAPEPAGGQAAPDPLGDLVAATQAAPNDKAAADDKPTPDAGSSRGGKAAPAETPASDEAAEPVLIPPPTIKAGQVLRFDLTSTENSPTVRGGAQRRTQQTLELAVVAAPTKDKPAVVRYTIIDGTAENDSLGRAMLAASRGVATEFEADSTGRPQRLTDWPKVRAAIFERLALDPAAPPDGVQKIRPALESMDPVTAITFAVPEVVMIADMQGWGMMAPGRHDDPQAGIGDGGARLVSWRQVGASDDKACTAERGRTSEIAAGDDAGAAKPQNRLETHAVVSTIDGWIVSLTQTSSRRTPAGDELRTWKLTRETPPGCG